MTNFQKLLRGLQVLNRYSGITGVGIGSYAETAGIPPLGVLIPIPASLSLDIKVVTELEKLGWTFKNNTYIFTP